MVAILTFWDHICNFGSDLAIFGGKFVFLGAIPPILDLKFILRFFCFGGNFAILGVNLHFWAQFFQFWGQICNFGGKFVILGAILQSWGQFYIFGGIFSILGAKFVFLGTKLNFWGQFFQFGAKFLI